MDNQEPKFELSDTNHYALPVTSSIQENVKLLDQVKSGFKRTINWNKYQSKVSIQTPNQYLHYLIDPSFQGVNQGVNTFFVLLFENNAYQISYRRYFVSTVIKKDYSAMIDGKKL